MKHIKKVIAWLVLVFATALASSIFFKLGGIDIILKSLINTAGGLAILGVISIIIGILILIGWAYLVLFGPLIRDHKKH